MNKELNNLDAFLTLANEILKTTQKGPRASLKHVYSDEENLVVTDGRILVAMTKTKQEIAPGFYDIAKVGRNLALVPASCDSKFPLYKMVMPKYSSEPVTMAFTKTEYMVSLLKLQDMAIKYCGGYVAEEYFELLKKSEFKYEVIVPINPCAEDECHPVLLKSNAVSVVVMPKRYNN